MGLNESTQHDKQNERPDSDEIIYVPLEGSLPAVYAATLNKPLCTLLHLAMRQERARPLTNQQYTTSEMTVLLPILEQYPHHYPYEMLLVSFNGSISEETIVRAPVCLWGRRKKDAGMRSRARPAACSRVLV
jgi:hypothetical protein